MNCKNQCIYINCKWLCLSIFLALLDISVKLWVKTHFLIGEKLCVFPGLNCYYVNNAGLALGLFSNSNIHFQWLFSGITILIIIVFLTALYRAVLHNLIYHSLSCSMIVGGAIGNLHDRILYGAVIDFIDCYIKSWHWPTFNIADIEICIGLMLLMIRRCYII